MLFKENTLQYADYFRLRESVGWANFLREQTEAALSHSQYDVVAIENDQVVAMGRLIGDGLYYTIVDVVVHPSRQGKGIGRQIINLLLTYADKATPPGGRTSVQLIAAKGKEPFYAKAGFHSLPTPTTGPGMRKILHSQSQE